MKILYEVLFYICLNITIIYMFLVIVTSITNIIILYQNKFKLHKFIKLSKEVKTMQKKIIKALSRIMGVKTALITIDTIKQDKEKATVIFSIAYNPLTNISYSQPIAYDFKNEEIMLFELPTVNTSTANTQEN